MSQYKGQQCLNAFGCRRDEFQHCQKFRTRTHAAAASAAAGGAGYTNAAAAEFTREDENQ